MVCSSRVWVGVKVGGVALALAPWLGAGCGETPEDPPAECADPCFSAPEPFCEGATRVESTSPGTCTEGTCVFQQTRTTCPYTCTDGACTTPCDGVVCNTPPAGTCDLDTYIGAEPTGTCDPATGGTCTYAPLLEDCAAGGQICDAAAERPGCVEPPPSCEDGDRNGEETDDDCGGTECAACAPGDRCRASSDCTSGVCESRTCAAPTCRDTVHNGAETDLDCGGNCPDCPVGRMCAGDSDCVTSACIGDVCTAAACDDGRKNGTETDVDCGGASCDPCEVTSTCNQASDCASGYCDATFICRTPTCADAISNGDETGVDCGGDTCDACGTGQTCGAASDCRSLVCTAELCVAATCGDTVRNNGETGVDCGGPSCAPCGEGEPCVVTTDCASGVCVDDACAAPTCDDGVRAVGETDIDCGGPVCPACIAGLRCDGDTDCASLRCVGGFCQEATCADGTRNQGEVGIDCGGPNCGLCDVGDRCDVNTDCLTGLCVENACENLPTCTDRVVNGTETGVDCGGGTCPTCGVGVTCEVNEDCRVPSCIGGTCRATITCSDGGRNGAETDVDCGGATCAACPGGRACLLSRDCLSTVCDDNVCTTLSCSDGVRNGTETDIDCGGATCDRCVENDTCVADSDCEPGWICLGVCAQPSCVDGLMNQDEIAPDCGGACGLDDYCVVTCPGTVTTVSAAAGTPGPSAVTFRYRGNLPSAATNDVTPPVSTCGAVVSGPERTLRIQVPATGLWRFTTNVPDPPIGVAATRIFGFRQVCDEASSYECNGNTIDADLVAGDVMFVVVDGVTPSEGGLAIAMYGSFVSAASCTDLIRNQGETDVDCGGPCSACPEACPDVVTPITLSPLTDRPGIVAHRTDPTITRRARYAAACGPGSELSPEDVYLFRTPVEAEYTFEVVSLSGGSVPNAVLSLREDCASDTVESFCAIATESTPASIARLTASASLPVTIVVDSTELSGITQPYVLRITRHL